MPLPNQQPAAAAAAAIEHIYKPEDTSRFEPRLKVVNREKSELLHKIRDSYDRARERLAKATAFKEEIFLGAGLSFGLLDPTTNIIYNTLVASNLCDEKIQGVQDGNIAERSLDGLVAFLTFFFRYLANWEAVRYLLLADADLVYAMRLVVHDRCISPFNLNSDTSKSDVRTALMCAALASKHMDPHHLVHTWLSPIRPLQEAVQVINNDINKFSCDPLHHACWGPVMQMQPLDFAWKRAFDLPRLPSTTVQYRPYQSMKFVLLGLIHTFYLNALALLPAGELRSCYHHSMLKAGHCYGPFDPVSNIIINTIWYNTVSPPSQKLELDMISTMSLLRIEARSFYGLVSFLCTSGKKLYEAMRFLLISDCTLGKTQPFSNPLSDFGDENKKFHAFRAAGVAAWHPDPVAQAEFISKRSHTLIRHKINAPLDSADVDRITRKMFQGPPTPGNSLQHQSDPMPKLYKIPDEHTRVSKKVKAALASYALENRESTYDLHVICGVNHNVSGPEYCMDVDKPIFIYHHIHVNFLASQGGGDPKLFFAELSNDDAEDGGRKVLCCPVNFPKPRQEQIRCMYCDYEGTKIVHPAMEEFQFRGHDPEFQNMACGIDPYEDEPCPDGVMQFYTNYRIISISCGALDNVGAVDDDSDDGTDEEDDSDYISESESE
ncbi:hypothetical protein CFC21_072052 [Triticum aestivum]|uniref:Uncharacterized protein n=3 Tax=Triticum TaxID=4564 RepID=A0A9R0XB70_TRITD|nr:uncharacterized protein LOC123112296 [Triticum aestivum]KAF7065992.1 hypothetical protein CFC21_072052 [Triticum aestivum]VAI33400.1 unnamed protein product [Triticum turgidum subsp. durum]